MAQIVDHPKSVLLSVKPPYAKMILDGTKTIELRRRFSSSVLKDTKVLIYATDPLKRILGDCRIKEVVKLPLDKLWKLSCRDAMISWNSFDQYFMGQGEGYGLLLYKANMYDQPISLETMRSEYNLSVPQSYRLVDVGF